MVPEHHFWSDLAHHGVSTHTHIKLFCIFCQVKLITIYSKLKYECSLMSHKACRTRGSRMKSAYVHYPALSPTPATLFVALLRFQGTHLSVRSEHKVSDFIFGVYKLFRVPPPTFISNGARRFRR